MKQKALIIGASPLPFVGPWVDISDGDLWAVKVNAPIGSHVYVELEPSGDRHAALEGTVVSGQRVRAIIKKEFNTVDTVNVYLEMLR